MEVGLAVGAESVGVEGVVKRSGMGELDWKVCVMFGRVWKC